MLPKKERKKTMDKIFKKIDSTYYYKTCKIISILLDNAIEALTKVGLENQIHKKPNEMSGGQMQRVSIARALYVQPTLLIFDEATSALDQAAEAEVQQAMLCSRGRRTNVIAAHRLSTLEICDSVLWLEGGRLRASGSAQSVMAQYRSVMEGRA